MSQISINFFLKIFPHPDSSLNELDLIKDLESKFHLDKRDFTCGEAKLNEIYFLKRHLININKSLEKGDYYLAKSETLEDWRELNSQKSKGFFGFPFRLINFISYRVFPRLYVYYLLISRLSNKNKRLISKAELLGRFIYSGFQIIQIYKLNQIHFFLLQKDTSHSLTKVSVGPLFKTNRVGKNGKLFKIYKLRTMHPYSEFLQQFMIESFGFSSNGKIKDDFRMTNWARIFRKYWLDELPQILNVIKGDMNLVGVRPVSESYFKKIPEYYRLKRNKYKPGCIPPYLALNLTSNKENVIKAEYIYLKLKQKKHLQTDIVFFVKSMYAIIFLKRRSY